MVVGDSKLAILVAGGPAPGINSVIGAATIRACLSDVEVLGVQDGFQWLMQGDTSPRHPADHRRHEPHPLPRRLATSASRARTRRRTRGTCDACSTSLERLGVGMLITIGGDDTAFTAYKLAQASQRRAARRARARRRSTTTSTCRTTSARSATRRRAPRRRRDRAQPDGRREDDGALVLRHRDGPQGRAPRARHRQGGGRDAHAHPRGVPARAGPACDDRRHARGAIIKRLAAGRTDGVAVLAEGLAEIVPRERPRGARDRRARRARAHAARRDQLRRHHQDARARSGSPSSGVKPTIVAKNIGYEVRCADPIPFDMEYTRDLGYCAAQVRHRRRDERARLDPARALQAGPVRARS